MEPVKVDLHLRRAGDHHCVKVSDKGRPGAGGQRLKTIGSLSYDKSAQKSIRMDIVCDSYRGGGVSVSGLQREFCKHLTSRRWACEWAS